MLYLGQLTEISKKSKASEVMETPENIEEKGGILDAIMQSQQQHALADFTPEQLVAELLAALKEREKTILSMRYGLSGQELHTLDAIGKKLGLTRERVRQVEKESIKSLKQNKLAGTHKKSLEVVRKTVEDHGGVFAQNALIDHLLMGEKSDKAVNALRFLLELYDDLELLKENEKYHEAWHVKTFDVRNLDSMHAEISIFLEKRKDPAELEHIREAFKKSSVYEKNKEYFSEKVIDNLLRVFKKIKSNPFGHYGLAHWRAISPKDVGDKAYLVLKHYGKPEHYTKITERINKHKFDDRTAYKETVHNELIMDPRFVLVGRGIYALKEWGYKEGVVSEVIREVLSESKEPMERSKIVDEVMKRRMVKRNTVLVGLANKRLFKKVGKSKYALA